LGFYESSQEVVVIADNYHAWSVGRTDCIWSKQRYFAIFVCVILNITGFRNDQIK